MNILLHGAVSGSNFGDCLFADIFYNTLRQAFPDDNIWFFDRQPFGISQYLRSSLDYRYIMSDDDYNKVDALVYISGGYLGEDKKSLKESLVRYKRYVQLGKKYISKKIPILIIGLEVGPIYYGFLRKGIRNILDRSVVLTVRNKESYDYCVENLNIRKAIKTQDTAICVASMDIPQTTEKLDRLFENAKKTLFLHVPFGAKDDEKYKNNILIPVVDFCKKHTEYSVIYGMDNEEKNTDLTFIEELFKSKSILCRHYLYSSYWEMCSLLSRVDFIVTTKLHTGIIGAAYGRAVVSTPVHRFKTERFYHEIGYSDHSYSYHNLTPQIMDTLLEEKHDKKIILDKSVYDKSLSNLTILTDSLKKIRENIKA